MIATAKRVVLKNNVLESLVIFTAVNAMSELMMHFNTSDHLVLSSCYTIFYSCCG